MKPVNSVSIVLTMGLDNIPLPADTLLNAWMQFGYPDSMWFAVDGSSIISPEPQMWAYVQLPEYHEQDSSWLNTCDGTCGYLMLHSVDLEGMDPRDAVFQVTHLNKRKEFKEFKKKMEQTS